MSLPVLVLDANIIIRAVLGRKVRDYLLEFSERVDFFTPDICIAEAQKYLPMLFEKRGISSDIPLETFYHVKNLLQPIDNHIYREREHEAKMRMKNRDIHDWPVVATALLFDCSIWTEDKDFFGIGIPVWTTDRIQFFFNLLDEYVEELDVVI